MEVAGKAAPSPDDNGAEYDQELAIDEGWANDRKGDAGSTDGYASKATEYQPGPPRMPIRDAAPGDYGHVSLLVLSGTSALSRMGSGSSPEIRVPGGCRVTVMSAPWSCGVSTSTF